MSNTENSTNDYSFPDAEDLSLSGEPQVTEASADENYAGDDAPAPYEDSEYGQPEYQEEQVQADQDYAAAVDVAGAQPKSRKRLMNMVITGTLVVAAIFAAYVYFSGPSVQEAPVADPAMDAAVTKQAPGQYGPNDLASAYEAPLPSGPAGGIDDMQGVTDPAWMDPNMGQVPAVGPAGPQAQIPAMGPTDMQPQVTPGQVQAPIAQIPVSPAAPVPVQQMPIDGNGDLMNRIASVEGRVDQVYDQVGQQTKKLDGLERSVNRLLTKKPARKASARKAAPAKSKALTEQQRFAASDLASKTAEPKATKNVAVKHVALAAIIPGRAFIEFNDSSRLDVEVGDAVPGCGSVKEIDADKGEVVTEQCTIK